MDGRLLDDHVKKLCMKNLADDRVSCCAICPFEEEIIKYFPSLVPSFNRKRDHVREKHGDIYYRR